MFLEDNIDSGLVEIDIDDIKWCRIISEDSGKDVILKNFKEIDVNSLFV